MSSFSLFDWLNQNQDEIVKYWQATLRDQDLSLLRLDPGSDQQEQLQELGRLYRDIVDATSSERDGEREGLVEWTRRCQQENGALLVDLLQVVFALRGAVGELLLEPAQADHAVDGWRALIPLFDRAVEVLAASYMQSSESPVDSDSAEKMQVATTGEKEHIDALYAIGRELNVSLDLDHVLEKTLDLVTRAVGARHGSVMLLDHDTGDLVYRARLGGRGPLPAGGEITPFKPGVGVAGWVVEHRKPALIGNVLEDDRWLAIRGKSPLTRALIAAPLLVGEDLHGVILISDGTPHRFGESHLKLVIAAAQQVAQTIRNAQLYDHVRGSADQLARMLRREQEETSKHQAVLQSIADGVIVSDTQDRVIVFNATAEAILEREADVVVGQDVCQLFDAFEEPGRSDALTALTKVRTLPDQTTGQVVEARLESNSKVISARLTPVVTEGGESLGVVIALRDITRIVEADRAKSEFVSTVSHELRTPLTSIKGYADLLRAEAVGGINEHQRQFLDTVKNNADRLTALINDLLDISYIETGRVRLQLDSVSLAEIVQSVVESLRPQIEAKDLKLEVDIPDHVDEITGDRARLIQVVTNLLDNACKYTDEGRIRVSLSCIEPSVDESIGRAVRLDVVDSGIGMSMEDQGRIFERFYRADATIREGRGGTGLGLAIARELIELHRGRIWVTSELGTGSTFTVILPSAVQELSAPLLAEVPAGARKILVVDDERDILALLQYQLGIQGYRVITASTGEQAIIKAIEERPDLITLDILLPDRNGFDVLRELKSRSETCHIPVIVLSVIQSEDSGYRLGVADYLVKPLDEGRLLGSISRLLGLRGKVLIAEDHPDTAEMLITLLRECGYEPLYANDGYETLAIARREQPGLILLDLRMPGMDGYEALTRLKKDPETRRIPILVMSAHAADVVQERLRVKGMGAEDFLPKPFSLENLLAEIERVTVSGGDSSH